MCSVKGVIVRDLHMKSECLPFVSVCQIGVNIDSTFEMQQTY